MILPATKLTSNTILKPLLWAALLSLLASTSALGDDTCIVCHTDEDLLADNLADTQKKTSTMQAGSG
jgi:hypothetical protein